MSLFQQLDEASQQAHRLLAQIQQTIETLPPNPRSVQFGPRCQVVRFADLRHGWEPATHDFAQQYRMVSDYLGRVSVDDVHRRLQEIVETGLVQQAVGILRPFRLHPAVKQHLATLLTGDAAPESEVRHVPES